jgi:hypothetical protein
VEGFVIGVGGFLGIGENGVALELDKLKMATQRRATQHAVIQVQAGSGY